MSNESTAGFRLSLQQKHLWVHGLTGPAYRSIAMLHLQGPLDPGRLRSAVTSVIERHEILRTTFQRQPGLKVPVQVVHDAMEPAWREVDLTGPLETEQRSEVRRIEVELSRRSVDLEHGPVVDLTLLKLAKNEHRLFLAIPSLCADAPTMRYVAAEIAHFYGGGSSGIEEDPIQYADYAEWQHELLQSSDQAAQADRTYWREQESIAAPVLSFPFDAARADLEGSDEPDIFSLEPDALSSRLFSLSSEIGHDPQLLLLACWGAFICRFTGEDTLRIAYGSNGRNHPDIQRAVGPYARTLPLVLSIDESLSLRELAGRVAASVREVESHQDRFAPAEEIRNDLHIGFEAGVKLVTFVTGELTITTESLWSYRDRIAVNLLSVHTDEEGEEKVNLHFQCDAEGSGAGVDDNVAHAFNRLLHDAVRNPDTPVSRLEIISQEKGKELLRTLSSRPLDYPRGRRVHEIFEEQAVLTPDALAVVSGETRWSFTDLNTRANRLASYLLKQGLRKGSPVGLLVDRSADMVAAMLGIIKAGGAYLPLHPDHPPLRLQTQLEQAGGSLVVTEESLLDRLSEFSGTIIALDRDAGAIASEAGENLAVEVGADDPAYVIYTSGSTGTPKGVVATHRNLTSYTYAVTDRLALKGETEPYHFALLSSITADLGNTSIYPSLLFGGCLHVISHETSIDGALFARYLAEHPIDVIKITPSHLGALIGTGGIENVLPRRTLVMGGEVLTWDLARRILSTGRCRLFNHYGPTEATVGALATAVELEEGMSGTVPLGAPLGNSEIYILDRYLRPVPHGAVGEIYIGGEGVAAGYVNQPGETAERFIPHPFSSDPAARLYRTGDRARFLRDGPVEFLGRVDSQVKIRGYRVELREIEEVMKGHRGVDQVAVVVRDEEGGDGDLVAYVVASSGLKVAASELRAYAAERLPEYMLPSSVVMLDRLPLSPNGKLDRRALPAPEEERAAENFVPPRSPLEETLAGIWRGVLRVERIGVHDNFFTLGGHSLLATQIVAQARSAFQVELPLRSIFESPTVAAMAAAIGDAASSASEEGDIASLLDDLENLSEEEAQQLLEFELKQRGDKP